MKYELGLNMYTPKNFSFLNYFFFFTLGQFVPNSIDGEIGETIKIMVLCIFAAGMLFILAMGMRRSRFRKRGTACVDDQGVTLGNISKSWDDCFLPWNKIIGVTFVVDSPVLHIDMRGGVGYDVEMKRECISDFLEHFKERNKINHEKMLDIYCRSM